jgi:Tfp pilus assembly protein PilZ
MDEDRRWYSRIAVQYPVTITPSVNGSKGLMRNISREGAYIHCDTPYEIDDLLVLTIELPDESPLCLTAKVIWVSDCDGDTKRFGMGVRIDSEFRLNY